MKKHGRFLCPGVHGTSNRTDHNKGAGVEVLHVAIDDPSRLGFACVHADENIPDVIRALQQMVNFYAFHRIKVAAILTNNDVTYRSRAFTPACRDLGITPSLHPPLSPQTNGKAGHFIQTLTREWAYACCYTSSQQRNACLSTTITPDLNPPLSRSLRYADNLSRYFS